VLKVLTKKEMLFLSHVSFLKEKNNFPELRVELGNMSLLKDVLFEPRIDLVYHAYWS
jgi:hypothetical protein